jgi:quercetin dioxygenase-like cupin family protein/DNA-binding XRE family transcriptional regulator
MAREGRRDASLDDAVADEVRAERIDSLSGPDSPEGRELGAAVGANLARLRAVRGLDRAALAQRSGIREPLLVALEEGHAVPSLRAIWHLATALEVPFGSLLANTRFTASGDPDFRVQPASRGRVIASATNEFRSRVLYNESDPRAPEVYELTLAPGCIEPAAAHAHDTYEHIVVVRGVLIVRSGEAEARLGPGDSIFFRADTPHTYENPAAEDVVAHLVMTYRARPETP